MLLGRSFLFLFCVCAIAFVATAIIQHNQTSSVQLVAGNGQAPVETQQVIKAQKPQNASTIAGN